MLQLITNRVVCIKIPNISIHKTIFHQKQINYFEIIMNWTMKIYIGG
ncbi:hypothetical protein C8N28_2592 [Albibacterium bauzanense]|uniref:Uncharacterized protein n=1 Tax=Albibacterium bauzanense TaxID=653929 RepID=A0A4R1LP42_9SPHI|nr:hypothetical protein C8N28_2592 [Albibacterium bauzanense]